jgi:hypothetical protein
MLLCYISRDMDFQKMLDESGYTKAIEDLEVAKHHRDILAGSIENAPPT